MKKLKMMSPNSVEQNIEKIAQWMPNIMTETLDAEGNLKKAIDFELLKQELSEVIVEGDKERYQLTWPGKKEAIVNANTPSPQTLRPIKEDSVDWDTTQNLYIEGDNLEVMKLLQESYLNKVKCIYIDPPYNTGNDFVYKDNYIQNFSEYFEESGQIDETSNKLFKNNESNGRFHSDWLKMIYPRLKIARNLLKEDGVIFISIDDNELYNMKKVCDEIFGIISFVGCFVWRRRASSAMASNLVSTDHEYILCYGKNSEFTFKGISKNYLTYRNPDNDPRGAWTLGDLTVGMNQDQRPNQFYDLIDPKTKKVYAANPNRVWAFVPTSMDKLISENRVLFPNETNKRPMLKRFKSELKREVDPISTLLLDIGMNSEGTKIIKKYFDIPVFNYSKPVSLVQRLIEQTTNTSDLILDFFSGSATTAEAVMSLNALDNIKRKFIMIQVPELLADNFKAQDKGLTNICEIGKERIRRAAQKIKAETSADIDYGFRVYRLDSSNMKDVYYTPTELGQIEFEDLLDNIKEDRTGEDLLTQVILSCGLELSLPMETKQLDHYKIHYVNNNELIACFDENIPDDVFKLIAKAQPEQVVFRDHSFKDDSTRINVNELFDTFSPNTEIRVL